MEQLIKDFEFSFDDSWLPADMLKLYSPIECLADNSGCTTLILENRETGEKCIAKCYNKDDVTISVTENEILSMISHKGLPKYMGQYENDQTVCVLREYIKGQPLDKIISQRKFTPEEISSFALKICDILDYLHTLPTPVLHRDIKPENIIIDENSDVYLIDFGISRILRDVEKKDTKIAATAAYAPPEQFGFLPTDARSDLYALGVVMNEMLTGSVTLNKNISDNSIGRIIRKCTAFSPNDRYNSARQLSLDIISRKYRAAIITVAAAVSLLAAALLVFGIFTLVNSINSANNIPTADSSPIILAEVSSSDMSGEGTLTFRLDTDSGVMTISGRGRITEDCLPSAEIINPRMVSELVFEEGITEIGRFHPNSYTNLKKSLFLPPLQGALITMHSTALQNSKAYALRPIMIRVSAGAMISAHEPLM